MSPGHTTRSDVPAFRAIRDWLHQETGLAYPESKRSFMERRLSELVSEWGARDLAELWERMQHSAALRTAVIDGLTINETRFFRMPAQFEALKQLLPELLAARRKGLLDRPRLRLWSAACSTGEEPYSLAMTLLALSERTFSAEILATDISQQALRRAEAGVYADWRLENLPEGFREAYFEADGPQLRVRAPVRDLVRFAPHNLKAPPPPGPWDVIFCRNVLIYFDQALRTELLRSLHGVLVPGGLLFVGEGETLHLVPHAFETLPLAGAVVYRRSPKE